MSFLLAPASNGGKPFSIPPVYISEFIEFVNAQPKLSPLPASLRSCQYGGSSSEKEAFSSILPFG